MQQQKPARVAEERTCRSGNSDAKQHLITLVGAAEKTKNRTIFVRIWGWFVAKSPKARSAALHLIAPGCAQLRPKKQKMIKSCPALRFSNTNTKLIKSEPAG
jgi:hypothetical protein